MADAAAILAQFGIKRPDITIAAAQAAGLELAVACAMLIGESSGGRMVWGSDGVSTGGIYVKGSPVDQATYLKYRDAVHAGRIGRQGVGDAQLTSAEFQDRGDQLGGCWLPYPNQLSGFIGLQNRIKQYGLRNGLRAYNGSGPAAETYADRRMAEIAVWRTHLAGATIPPGDDMAAVPQNEWNDVHAQEMRKEPPWAGGYTDAQNSEYDAFMYGKRNNVEIHQCWLAIQALTAKVDALAAQLAAKP